MHIPNTVASFPSNRTVFLLLRCHVISRVYMGIGYLCCDFWACAMTFAGSSVTMRKRSIATTFDGLPRLRATTKYDIFDCHIYHHDNRWWANIPKCWSWMLPQKLSCDTTKLDPESWECDPESGCGFASRSDTTAIPTFPTHFATPWKTAAPPMWWEQ